jgi:hypothetical protein
VTTEAKSARKPGATLTIRLESGRWRHLAWAAGGLAAGLGLLFVLGAVGKAVGALLLLMALASGISFVRTLRPAGAIRISGESVELPAGLCARDTEAIPLSEIKHVYFLRRAVPWPRSGPLLVLETGRGVFAFPHDWFASDSDQRRVALAIHKRQGRA